MADFIAFDVETANRTRESICAIGYVIVENGEIIQSQSHLIKPYKNSFSKRNTQIHGITREDVQGQPKFPEIWKTYLEELFTTNILIAHNAAFDAYVLRDTLDVYKIPLPEINYLCSLQLSKTIWTGMQSHRLNQVAEYLGIELDHHDPLSDALAAAKIVLTAMQDTNTKTINQLARKTRQRIKTLPPKEHIPKSEKEVTVISDFTPVRTVPNPTKSKKPTMLDRIRRIFE